MLRSCFVLLLLTHYLLVVGAGLVGRPEPVRQHAADYLHSADCQRQHYLQLDCFDHCNGEQYATTKPGQHQSWPQLLSSLKGIDLHCLSSFFLITLPDFQCLQPEVLAFTPLVPDGVRSILYAPPRQG